MIINVLKDLPTQHGEVTSVDMKALVLGNGSETGVEKPNFSLFMEKMERSRNLEE